MRGFKSPKITKEDVEKVLTKDDYRQTLEILGYKLVPKKNKSTSKKDKTK